MSHTAAWKKARTMSSTWCQMFSTVSFDMLLKTGVLKMNCHRKVFVIHLVPVLAYLADMSLRWVRAWADFFLSVFWLAEGNVLYALLIVGDRIFFLGTLSWFGKKEPFYARVLQGACCHMDGPQRCCFGEMRYFLAQVDKVILPQSAKKITNAEDNVLRVCRHWQVIGQHCGGHFCLYFF